MLTLRQKCNKKTADGKPSAVVIWEVKSVNYNEALQYIHSLGKFGSKPGLERIEKMLSLMGDPQKQLEFIHVAGTNGKGSTSTFIAAALEEQGLTVGLYTSPFVTEFNERIRLNGQNISNDDLSRYTEYTENLAKEVFSEEYPITEFEFITALAFKYFADKRCDVVVLEVGLGGRLDATNVIEKPKASVIVKIDLDHTGILGDTIEKIAAEKCGIIKSGCPVVTTSQNEPSVLNVIKGFAASNGCTMHLNSSDEVKVISSDVNGNVFTFEGREYRTKMPGIHQIDNALTAIKTLKVAYPEISYENIYNGIKKTTLAARCEVISKEPLLLLDGSHNPNGTSALADLLKKNNVYNAVGVLGFMADKDVPDALKKVLKHFKKVYTVTVESNPRAMSAENLAELCKTFGVVAEAAPDYCSAVKKALSENKNTVVFGSLYLAGDIRPILLDFKR